MADKLIVILMNTDPSSPTELLAPFTQATMAASMGYQSEMIFTGRAAELLKQGVASEITVPDGSNRSVLDLFKEAYKEGVVLKYSFQAFELWGEDFIAEVKEFTPINDGYIVQQAMNRSHVVFTY